MGIVIVTDSTSYLSNEILEKYNIKMISLSVLFGDTYYKETEITNEDFFVKLKAYDSIPKSSQPSINETTELFDSILADENDLIGVFVSSDMSGTYSTSVILKTELEEKYPKRRIEMIDSRSNCMQLGLATLAGAKAIKGNKTFDEVLFDIDSSIKKSRFVFMPETLEYLKKGGRIGTAGALLGSILQIKPILTVENGITTTLGKVRTRKKALQALINKFKEDLENNELVDAFVQHIDCEEDAITLAELIENKTGKRAKLAPIGPVIGSHVGPGAIGIAYSWR